MSQNLLSMIQGISGMTNSKNTEDNGVPEKEDSDGEESDKSEIEATVEDLMCIQKKEVLKRNIMVIVKENFSLKRQIKKLKSKAESQPQIQNLSFHLDTTGNDVDPEAANIETILYNENKEVLTGTVEEKVEDKEEKKTRPKNTCFNCLGDHMIMDCKEPKDPKQISRNRKEFQQKQVSYNSLRYHEDEPQKFGEIQPGLPSEKLRKALGLESNQLPEYIYRMRGLGYPPGWLKYAQISHSGMNLYKAFGEKLGHHGDEDGEVVEAATRVKYDTSKLKEWPGFNSYPSRDFRDQTNYYRVPPITKRMLLEEMIKELKPREQKGYKRRKMQDVSTSRDDHKEQGMDLDTDSQEENSDSPPPPGEEDLEVIDKWEKEEGEESEDEVKDEDITGDVRGDVKSTPIRMDSTTSSSSVSKTEPGTPIVEIFSPFGSLPNMDSFAKDATDHILFENLPDYTGKWKQMSGLISNIRKRRSEMEKEDDKDY